MPFLTEVHFQNYRSFLDAQCRLSPVTVVIGANNAGKSNFLRGLAELCNPAMDRLQHFRHEQHRSKQAGSMPISIQGRGIHGFQNTLPGDQGEILIYAKEDVAPSEEDGAVNHSVGGAKNDLFLLPCVIHRLNAFFIGVPEIDQERPSVHPTGEGVTRVLQLLSLKYRKTFRKLEEEFQQHLQEVEELTFERAEQGKWFIQVIEKGFKDPVSLSELSEGSRTILALLTILYQPNRPELILIEDIEHAIHPRGLKPMLETIRRISREHGVQIIMTTQSPYVLDCFQQKEFWADVVIVEKTAGVSRLTNADERLVALGYDEEKMETVSLGDLWFSGLLGGVAGPNELWDEPSSESVQP